MKQINQTNQKTQHTAENRPQNRPDLMSLCSYCASQFFNSGSCRIRRADPYQIEKESCIYCGYRKGYDYLIYPVTTDTDTAAKRTSAGHASRRNRPARKQSSGRKGGISICTVRTMY